MRRFTSDIDRWWRFLRQLDGFHCALLLIAIALALGYLGDRGVLPSLPGVPSAAPNVWLETTAVAIALVYVAWIASLALPISTQRNWQPRSIKQKVQIEFRVSISLKPVPYCILATA